MINILKLAFLTASAVSLQIIQCKVAGKAAEIFNKIIKYEKMKILFSHDVNRCNSIINAKVRTSKQPEY